jgi:hypothetical protein
MSESPVHSDPEKTAYGSDTKGPLDTTAPLYDEAIGETEAIEFSETKELRWVFSLD